MSKSFFNSSSDIPQMSASNPKNNGFTLIELIIVIVILGILSVVAAPKFVDIGEDAHLSVTITEIAAFKSAVDLVRTVYLLRKTTPIEVAGGSVAIDAVSGFPTGSGSGSASCVDLWNDVLQNPEPVTAVSNPYSSLATGWNTFRYGYMCAYGKKFGDRTFASGNLPHFVYYIRDTSSGDLNGTTYGGSAGSIQKVHF